MAPLRVLQVCSSLAWGGTEMHVPILSSALQERGHEVLALCHPDGKIRMEMDRRGIRTELARIGGYVNPCQTLKIARLLRVERPDVLHLHLSRDIWQVVPAAIWTHGPPIVLTKHVGSYVRKHDVLHKWLYHRISHIVTVSDTLRDNVIDTCPVDPDRVSTIHHALDLTRYDPSRCTGKAEREEFGIGPEDLVVGTIGRISHGKGVESFLKAAEMIVRKKPDLPVRFVVVGGASYGEEAYFESIKSMAESSCLDGKVVVTGFRTDIPDLLAAMDVFIFPSHAEGLGATLIEAMAMEVACVSTYSDGTRDIIQDQRSGLTVGPADATAMAERTLDLLLNDDRRKTMAAGGRLAVEEKFDLRVMTDKLSAVYDECISARSGGEPGDA